MSLKHYTNRLRETVQEEIDQLKEIGLDPSIGEPCATETYTTEQIKMFGVDGIYINVSDENDHLSAKDIVKAAWDIELLKDD